MSWIIIECLPLTASVGFYIEVKPDFAMDVEEKNWLSPPLHVA